MGRMELIVSIRWIANVESTFLANFFPIEAKVKFTACLLHDGSREWWREVVQGLKPGAVEFTT